ncbi:hypothetical protein CALVIDRAFT_601421 [Calocera viscosa TUFC12733]|uniref:Transcription initiation factor TFIID subunit 12 domain-containing protein n=1 Tax=Calocera viscosa (strain TUFC12733) TaxID=1330018 RepID=A0A167IG13_CALVF|nr:hypothetical protein CALVIDRAFT_601421 [Calocera viscosa TUFC12733]
MSTPSGSGPSSQSSQPSSSGTPTDLLKALDNALAFAASKPEAARQIAEALKSHMPGLVALAQEGRLTQSQFQQLEALMKSGSQPQPQGPGSTSGTNGWTNGRPAGVRQQTAAAQSATTQTPAYPSYYANGAAPVQEYDEKEWLRGTLQQMAYALDPEAVLDREAEELLLDAVFDFVSRTSEFGSRLARHRGSDTLQVKDVQLYLERHLGIRVPGFATEETRQPQPDLPVAASGRGGKPSAARK